MPYSHTPQYGAPAAYTQQPVAPIYGRARPVLLPRRGAVQQFGATPGDPGIGLGTAGYAISALVGAAVGGALIGFVAEGSSAGAIAGGLFAGGLGAVSDALLFSREANYDAAIMIGAVGLAAMSYPILKRLGGGSKGYGF